MLEESFDDCTQVSAPQQSRTQMNVKVTSGVIHNFKQSKMSGTNATFTSFKYPERETDTKYSSALKVRFVVVLYCSSLCLKVFRYPSWLRGQTGGTISYIGVFNGQAKVNTKIKVFR